jgi:hypothetical protein
MRTSTTITEVEKNAYDSFCEQHHILNDQSADALRNGEEIGTYIGTTWNEDITERTLTIALEKLGERLTFIPPEQVEVAEILAKLDKGQRDIVASWLCHQHRLEVDGPKGFSNVSVLVAWLLNRRYAVSEAGLDMALGNVQNSGRRKIFWKENPKQSREYVQGRPNHAFGQTEEPKAAAKHQREYVSGRRNHAYTRPENAPVSVNPSYQSKAESVQGRTHGQTDQVRRLFVMVPGTTTIDWEGTLAVRQRFVNKQAALVRR